MPFFSHRVSMLEVQNRALIKTARERAERIDKLEHELQQVNREMERLIVGVERLKAEREFYSKRVVALEEQNRQLTQSATKYSLWGQKLERELATRSTRRRRCLRPSARRSENTYSPCRMARSARDGIGSAACIISCRRRSTSCQRSAARWSKLDIIPSSPRRDGRVPQHSSVRFRQTCP